MPGKSWTIFRVRGIPIELHISLLLFLPYVAFASSVQYRALARSLGADPAASALPPFVWGTILAVGLFAAILLHELGHSFVALANGVRVRSITLMMLGGVSSMDRDISAWREAWMAFAGPLVSFVIGAGAYLGHRAAPPASDASAALLAFAVTNAVVGAFNLLPAFPLDGGRVLRGLLTRPFGVARATEIATRTGQIVAIALGLWGLWTLNVMLVLIASFVYMGAAGERRRASTHDALRGVPVSQVMNDQLGDALAGESAAEVARRLLDNHWVGARVVRPRDDAEIDATGERRTTAPPLGVVTAWDLRPSDDDEAGQPGAKVGERLRADLPRVRSDEDASRALELFLGSQGGTVLVEDERHRVVGVLTAAEIDRALTLARAMWRGRTPAR